MVPDMQRRDELERACAEAIRAYRAAVADDAYGYRLKGDRAQLTHIVHAPTGSARIKAISDWMPIEQWLAYIHDLTATGDRA